MNLRLVSWGWILIFLLAACDPMQTPRILVEWTTATEMETAGFNLYKSENPDGPYTKINEGMIPASSDPVTGGKYRYQDAMVIPGKTYYYQLEDVELNGKSTRHGPIVIKADSPFGQVSVWNLIVFGAGGAVVLGVAVLIRRWHLKIRKSLHLS